MGLYYLLSVANEGVSGGERVKPAAAFRLDCLADAVKPG
jgi:hypothetical protein